MYKSKGGRRWPKRVLIGVGALVIVLVLALIASFLYVDSTLGGIKRISVSGLTPAKSGQPLDVLMIGSDSRSGETSAQQRAAFGSAASVTGQRADVIIVARFFPSGKVEMLSVPRDLWVPIAGTGGSNRINSAFNNGPSQLVQSVQQDLKIPINHVMMVGFEGFSGMVNSLGGIYLDFSMPVYDRYSGLHITKTGCQLVGGTQALALVRSRHLYYYDHGWQYDGFSDWSRIRRQQAFFHALLDRLHGVIPDVFRLNSFLGASVGDIAVDQNFASSQMITLGMKYHSLGTSNLVSAVLPTSPAVIDGSDVLLPPQPQVTQAINQFLAGTTATTASAVSGHTGAVLTSTAGSIVYDNPQSLPEPWNPTPC